MHTKKENLLTSLANQLLRKYFLFELVGAWEWDYVSQTRD